MKPKGWLVLVSLAANAFAAPGSPSPIAVDELLWIAPPQVSGMRFTWVLGSEQHVGLYAIRVKLDRGAKIPPHTHPDERNSTVLAGTLYVGFGEQFDASGLVAIRTGDVYIAPAGVAHYLFAKDGDVVYQESGIGPTAAEPIKTP